MIDKPGAGFQPGNQRGRSPRGRGGGIMLFGRKALYRSSTLTVLAVFLACTGAESSRSAEHSNDTGKKRVKPVPTAVDLIAFEATASAGRVRLTWSTGFEVDNLGFRIYREDGDGLTRVAPSMVAGSALFAGPQIPLTSGRSYSWSDAWVPGSRYWLESIDLAGRAAWHGPVIPVAGSSEAGLTEPAAALLADLARGALVPTAGREPGLTESPAPLLPPRSPVPTLQQKESQFELAAQRSFKIGVRETGWYRIGQQELVAAGLSPMAEPALLRIYADGIEQAIQVHGEEDGRFDSNDWIQFYGLGIDTPWTDTRTYWLVLGQAPGKRVRAVTPPGASAPAESFPMTVERRERTIYVAALDTGDRDNFFGPVIEAGGTVVKLDVHHLHGLAATDAVLEVGVQGGTDTSHRIQVSFNGTQSGEIVFSGQEQAGLQTRLSLDRLADGENTVRLVSLGGELDVSLVDFVRLTYPHKYVADRDMLSATLPPDREATLEGFSDPSVRVFDVTNPDEPSELAGRITSRGSEYAITVSAPGSASCRILALADGRGRPPEWTLANAPSDWNRQSEGADAALVAHGSFLRAASDLKAQQEAQGLTVSLIDVQDIFDEYSFGAKDPRALREFLVQADAVWKKRPRFLTLLGDASLDPRNYLGTGQWDVIPTQMVATTHLRTANDDWYGDFNGDGIPEIAVGRIPVRSPDEAVTTVAKIGAYRQSRRTADWTRHVLFVSDFDDGFDFAGASARLKAELGAGFLVEEVRREQGNDTSARNAVLDGMFIGKAAVSYFGHGSVELWRGSLLTSEDARNMTNGARLPLVIAMNCLNGYFPDLYTECLAEALIRNPQGGAVAMWSSSGLTEPEGQLAMSERAFRLLQQRDITLGEALRQAKAAVSDVDVRKTWVLMGDPTLPSPLGRPPLRPPTRSR